MSVSLYLPNGILVVTSRCMVSSGVIIGILIVGVAVADVISRQAECNDHVI